MTSSAGPAGATLQVLEQAGEQLGLLAPSTEYTESKLDFPGAFRIAER